MMAQENPTSFLSGVPLDLNEKLKEANRTEFHHLMPRKFLRDSGQTSISGNALVNFAFLSRADNREIGGAAPSQYREKMQGDVSETLNRSIIPDSLFNDDYSKFAADRSVALLQKAADLCDLIMPVPEGLASDFVVEMGDFGGREGTAITLPPKDAPTKDKT